MSLWLLAACVAHGPTAPLPPEHVGRPVRSPCLPLPPVWVEASAEAAECALIAEAIRYVLVEHSGQTVRPDADTRLQVTRCETRLEERVSISPEKTAALGGQEVLNAVLTGHGVLDVEIWRFGLALDKLSVESLEIEQQEWVSGGQYPWRAALALQVEQVLVERAENALLQPRRSMCISGREQAVSLAARQAHSR